MTRSQTVDSQQREGYPCNGSDKCEAGEQSRRAGRKSTR